MTPALVFVIAMAGVEALRLYLHSPLTHCEGCSDLKLYKLPYAIGDMILWDGREPLYETECRPIRLRMELESKKVSMSGMPRLAYRYVVTNSSCFSVEDADIPMPSMSDEFFQRRYGNEPFFKVLDDKGREIRPSLPGSQQGSRKVFTLLRPGESQDVSKQCVILDGYRFPRPGRYSIQSAEIASDGYVTPYLRHWNALSDRWKTFLRMLDRYGVGFEPRPWRKRVTIPLKSDEVAFEVVR